VVALVRRASAEAEWPAPAPKGSGKKITKNVPEAASVSDDAPAAGHGEAPLVESVAADQSDAALLAASQPHVDAETLAVLESLPAQAPAEPVARGIGVSGPLMATVGDAVGMRNGEFLADCCAGAAFGRPAIPEVLAKASESATSSRPFLATDSPITDVFVDPTTGELLLRWHVPSATSVAPAAQMLTTAEEAARTHPQVLIDFLLSSVVFE
jgi:hypothetical protein